MERRELLKALGVVPFTRLPYKETYVDAVEVAPHKYWVFIDMDAVAPETFSEPWPWPGCDAEIFLVKPKHGQSVQDAVVIYKIGEDENQKGDFDGKDS